MQKSSFQVAAVLSPSPLRFDILCAKWNLISVRSKLIDIIYFNSTMKNWQSMEWSGVESPPGASRN